MSLECALKEVDREISRALFKKEVWLKKLFKDSNILDGKKLRARIFFAFCENHAQDSIKAAAAIKILHAAILIHDDILDGALLRRGKTSLYILFAHFSRPQTSFGTIRLRNFSTLPMVA